MNRHCSRSTKRKHDLQHHLQRDRRPGSRQPPDDRRDALISGLQRLTRDPYVKIPPVRGDENARSIALTKSLAVEYGINNGYLFILVVHIVNTERVLMEEN